MPYPIYDTKRFNPMIIQVSAWVLALTASMVMGFLSFGGMLAIWPASTFMALCAFLLTMAYEGEINRQTSEGAIEKIIDPDYAKKQLSRQYLLHKLASFRFDASPEDAKQYPLYLQTYMAQVRRVHVIRDELHEQRPNKRNLTTIAAMERHIDIIEEIVNDALFENNKEISDVSSTLPPKNHTDLMVLEQTTTKPIRMAYKESNPIEDVYCYETQETYLFNQQKKELITWIANDRAEWQTKLNEHHYYLRIAGVASVVSGFVMALGSSYLILEAFATVPYLTLISASLFSSIITPLAIVSGLAYGLMVYDSLSDMLIDNPFTKFWNKLKAPEPWTLKTKLFLSAFLFLFTLSTLLTICTAGTWIAVFNQPQALFSWISLIPNLLLNTIIPIFIGLSNLPFSLQSIANSLDNLEHHPKVDAFFSLCTALYNGTYTAPAWTSVLSKFGLAFLSVTPEEFAEETTLQRCNPFRLLIGLFNVLIVLVFLAHLFCMGEMSDRLDGFPVWTSVGLSMVLELFEDFDFLFGHSHIDANDAKALLHNRFSASHDHDHNSDLPSFLLKTLFYPAFYGAATWHHYFQKEPNKISFKNYLDRMEGFQPKDKQTITKNIPKAYRYEHHHSFLFHSQSKPQMLTSNEQKNCSKLHRSC